MRAVCTADRLEELKNALEQHYNGLALPEYEGHLLVPRLFRSSWEFPPADDHVRPPWSTSLDTIKHALLYAHGVEVADPLVVALRTKDTPAIINALEFWISLRPLIEAGIVNVVAPNLDPLPDLPFLTNAHDENFRRGYVKFFVENQTLRRFVTGCDAEAAVQDSNEFSLFVLHSLTAEGNDLADDIVESLRTKRRSNASFWLPNSLHYRLISLFLEHGIRTTLSLSEGWQISNMLSLEVPRLSELDLAEIIRIRQDSEVFDAWREALGNVLHAMETLPSETGRRTKESEFRHGLMASSAKIQKNLELSFRDAISQQMKNVGIGSFAGAATGLVTGGFTGATDLLFRLIVGSAAAAGGGVARGFAEEITGLGNAGRRKRALNAVPLHVMVFAAE
jgi:hypothetical protein